MAELFVEDPVLRVDEFDGDFCLGPQSDLFRRIAANHCYEPKIAGICRTIGGGAGDFVDVGANVGFFSVLLGRANPDRRVLAVEPSAAALARLRSNVLRNGLADRVIVEESALGSQSGQSSLSIVPGKEEYSTLGSLVHPAISGSSSSLQEVAIRTLDSLVESLGLEPSFVKIDVEGAELDVLRGAAGTLEIYRPIILCELNDRLLETRDASSESLLGFLSDHRYSSLDVETLGEPSGRSFGEILAIPTERADEIAAKLRAL